MLPSPVDPLAYLGFQLAAPGVRLRPYVRSYWHFRREAPLPEFHEEYMHPTGGFGIVFNFGDPVQLNQDGIDEPIFLDGANTVSRKMGFTGQVDLLGVRFYEGGAYPFLGLPLNELRNETGLLDALDRRALLRVHARLGEAKTLAARIALLEDWLAGRLVLGKELSALVPASLKLLRESEFALPIPELAGKLAIGQRQLERLYQSQVGMSPRQYALLLRIDAARLALKRLRHAEDPSTTAVATELGFYDQSHFIHEFSAVVGMTPYAYLKRGQRGPH